MGSYRRAKGRLGWCCFCTEKILFTVLNWNLTLKVIWVVQEKSKGLGEERGLLQSTVVHGRAQQRVYASTSITLHGAEAPCKAAVLKISSLHRLFCLLEMWSQGGVSCLLSPLLSPSSTITLARNKQLLWCPYRHAAQWSCRYIQIPQNKSVNADQLRSRVSWHNTVQNFAGKCAWCSVTVNNTNVSKQPNSAFFKAGNSDIMHK